MTKSFEEFEVYLKGIQLAKLIFKLLENKSFEKEYNFKDQIIKSSYFNNQQHCRRFRIQQQ